MARDEASSQDATLIDEDLVAALGFEPVSTMETDVEATETNGNGSNGHVTVDDVTVDDVVADDGVAVMSGMSDVVDEDALATDDDIEILDDEIELVEDSADVADPVHAEEAEAADAVGSTSSFFDLEPVVEGDGEDVIEEIADAAVADDAAVDEIDLADDATVDEAIAEEAIADDATVDEAIVDEDVAGDDLSVGDVSDEDVPDGDDDVIVADLAVDDSPATEAVAPVETELDTAAPDDEIIDLADPDSVFADTAAPVELPDLDLVEPDGLVAEPTTTISTVDVDQAAPIGEAAVAPAAVAVPNKRRRRLRARKARRVVRHIDPWSVLTFSVLFHMVVFAALLLASVLVWNAAIASGMVENVEAFIQELGDYETFEINADVMFRAAIVIAGMLTLASSVLVVLLTVVFNLISDLVGGIRVTVIEEEVVRVPLDKKQSKAGNE